MEFYNCSAFVENLAGLLFFLIKKIYPFFAPASSVEFQENYFFSGLWPNVDKILDRDDLLGD